MPVLETAAVIAAITVPTAALLITVIKTKAGTKDNQSDNKTLRDIDKGICGLHSGVEKTLTMMCEQQEEMRKDIKELLKRGTHQVGI